MVSTSDYKQKSQRIHRFCGNTDGLCYLPSMDVIGFQWHLTDRCNLRCAHCYQQDFSPAQELPLEDMLSLADSIFSSAPHQLIEVNLTGGEPLLYPHLVDLVGHLHGYDNLKEINLITNGTVTNGPLLESLAGFRKLRYLKVSLESGVAAINDRIRGPGILARVRSNLAELRRCTGRPIALMVTLARYNLFTIRETVDFARAEGLSGVIFERFVPLGTGDALASEVLSADDWKWATGTLLDLADMNLSDDELLPYRAFWLGIDPSEGPPLAGAECNLGEASFALMPGGDVYPCRRFPRSVGNLLREPFAQIRSRLADHSPTRAHRKLTGPICGGCQHTSCAGCRALVHALNRAPEDDDPQCAREVVQLGKDRL